jgi:hypothetical protein
MQFTDRGGAVSRPRIRSVLPLLLVAALAPAALAACGSAGSPSSGKSDDEKRLAFDDCLRQHGVNVQTTSDGRFMIRQTVSAGSAGNGKATFGSGGPDAPNGPFAICRRQTGWAPSPPTAKQQAEARDQGLRIARCMRSHGVDMADPAPDGRVLMRVPGDSPTFQAAARACGMGGPDGAPPGGKGNGFFSATRQ